MDERFWPLGRWLAWEGIERITTVDVGSRGTPVAFMLRPEHVSRASRFCRGDVDSMLHDTYGLPPADLVDVISRYRGAAQAAAADPLPGEGAERQHEPEPADAPATDDAEAAPSLWRCLGYVVVLTPALVIVARHQALAGKRVRLRVGDMVLPWHDPLLVELIAEDPLPPEGAHAGGTGAPRASRARGPVNLVECTACMRGGGKP